MIKEVLCCVSKYVHKREASQPYLVPSRFRCESHVQVPLVARAQVLFLIWMWQKLRRARQRHHLSSIY